MAIPHVCLIGQFVVDVTLPTRDSPYKLRAGGIMHAARALWAIDCPYTLCFCAPEYLTAQVMENAGKYGAKMARQFGVVSGCPNVILIAEPKETGDQGYEFLLRDYHTCHLDTQSLSSALEQSGTTDALLFPGGFDLLSVLLVLSHQSTVTVFADANFEPRNPSTFGALGRPFETLIYSTSSQHFLETYHADVNSLNLALADKYSKSVLLKENRGGSRFFRDGSTIQTPAQLRAIQHSVGVGDCFDAVFVGLRHRMTERAALAYASCIAAEYASTTYPEIFRERAQAWLRVPVEEISELQGVSLAWELRPAVSVYIAAPDFEGVDRKHLDALVASLRYHNLSPRLPVREHGQMGRNASDERRQTLYEADLRLLDECQLLVAVMLFDDPGTLIEIGIASERGIPVIVYDPYMRADNLMLTQLPFHVSGDLDQVISAVFDRASYIART